MTWAEIGEALGISEDAARKIGERALEKLKKNKEELKKIINQEEDDDFPLEEFDE